MRNPLESSGDRRASVRGDEGCRTVRESRRPYANAPLLEWGSITKGVVGTTVWLPLFGRPITPGVHGESSFAAAGGIWSTFDDRCRYADWVLEPDAGHSRTVSWQHEGVSQRVNGEVRAAGVVILAAAGVVAAVHTRAKAPHAADRIATELVEQEVRVIIAGLASSSVGSAAWWLLAAAPVWACIPYWLLSPDETSE
jgi:hypothetical protein